MPGRDDHEILESRSSSRLLGHDDTTEMTYAGLTDERLDDAIRPPRAAFAAPATASGRTPSRSPSSGRPSRSRPATRRPSRSVADDDLGPDEFDDGLDDDLRDDDLRDDDLADEFDDDPEGSRRPSRASRSGPRARTGARNVSRPDARSEPAPPLPPYIVITVPRIRLRAPAWAKTVAQRTGLSAATARYRQQPPSAGSAALAALAILVLFLATDGTFGNPPATRTSASAPQLDFTPTGLFPGLAGDPSASLGLGSPAPGTFSVPPSLSLPASPALSVPPAAPPATLPPVQTPSAARPTAAKREVVPGIPAQAKAAYVAAAAKEATADPACGLSWPLLAAIGAIESDHARFGGSKLTAAGISVPAIYGVRLDGSKPGTGVVQDTDQGVLDGDTSYDRAVGAMQFLPGTWKSFAADGDGDGVANPQDLHDSTLTAARYLCRTRPSTGAGATLSTPAGQWAAAFRYNRSTSYANWVLARATGYVTGQVTTVSTPPDGAVPTTSTTTITSTSTTTTSASGTTATSAGGLVTVTVTVTPAAASASTATSTTTATSSTSTTATP